MSIEKAQALVLRVIDFSESSVVVTLWTREFGKIQALAKGARRPKGPFEAALDLLCQCRIVFLRKTSDALDLVTEARLERRFRPAGRDLTSLYAAYYVAELLNQLTHDGDPHPELYDLASETLEALSSGATAAAAVVLRFELVALRQLGHLPTLAECAECGAAVGKAARYAFGLVAGGVLCPACRPGKRNVASVSAEAVEWLARFAAEGPAWREAELSRARRGELRGLMNQYLVHLLGHRLRMHAYLGMLGE